MKFAKGDTVLIQGLALHDSSADCFRVIFNNAIEAFVPTSSVVQVVQWKWTVGELATWGIGDAKYPIVGIHQGKAWFGDHAVVDLADLRRPT